VTDGRLEPPPSADPGPDTDRVLREIREAKPEFGCLGRSVTGCGAIAAMGGVILVIACLIGRRGS
jgi:hypothetical protein